MTAAASRTYGASGMSAASSASAATPPITININGYNRDRHELAVEVANELARARRLRMGAV